VSWISDTFAGIKRLMLLDAEIARLQRAADKAEATGLDHEKRLTRIETLIELGGKPVQLPVMTER
jgi:hypothetical protein